MLPRFQHLPVIKKETFKAFEKEDEVGEIAERAPECMKELESNKFLLKAVLRGVNIADDSLVGEIKEKAQAYAVVAQLLLLRLVDKQLAVTVDEAISDLEKRVTILEAENILLKKGD